METTFKLDGCHTLTIRTDPPRLANDKASVSVQIDRVPLPVLMQGPDSSPIYGQGPIELVAVYNLRPSEARAIASAMLSAATESRQ